MWEWAKLKRNLSSNLCILICEFYIVPCGLSPTSRQLVAECLQDIAELHWQNNCTRKETSCKNLYSAIMFMKSLTGGLSMHFVHVLSSKTVKAQVKLLQSMNMVNIKPVSTIDKPTRRESRFVPVEELNKLFIGEKNLKNTRMHQWFLTASCPWIKNNDKKVIYLFWLFRNLRCPSTRNQGNSIRIINPTTRRFSSRLNSRVSRIFLGE